MQHARINEAFILAPLNLSKTLIKTGGNVMDDLDDLMLKRAPTARRPLLGLTVLVVEDSRFACEALRLLCLRSGARIRRADRLEHARKHLAIYRPSVIIVDVSLPDGSGLALIEELNVVTPRIDVIFGTSGDPDAAELTRAAGADGFLAKPIASLTEFQTALLAHLPKDRQPPGPRILTDEVVTPDLVALRDDLSHVIQVIEGEDHAKHLDYVTQFLSGITRSVDDPDLDRAVTALARDHKAGVPTDGSLAALNTIMQSRLAAGGF